MFRFLVFLFTILFISSNTGAQESDDIALRVSERDGFVRIVFESQRDSQIARSKIFASHTLVKVDFPESFSLKEHSIPSSVSLSIKERSLYLRIKNLDKIKEFKLASPPRLVIDAFLKGYKPPEITVGKKSLRSIMLDAGHGGHDSGIRVRKHKESAITLSLTKSLASSIKSSFKKIYLTREDSNTMSLKERISVIQSSGPDIFLSFHLSNANYFALYTGIPFSEYSLNDRDYNTAFSLLKHKDKSKALARSMGTAFRSVFNTEILYREMPLPLLSYANAPSVLIELPGADFLAYDGKTLSMIANAVSVGLSNYGKR